jgi:TPP-dependent pyruvate/acetoin dehydrogenase alpha subunit
MMGTSAVVGTTIANAMGYAYALRYGRRAVGHVSNLPDNPVIASFFGDGATEEGVFAESLNFAVLKRLPVLFICENNRYAIHTHQRLRQGKPAICDRARAHGLPAELLDGNDILHLSGRARDVVARVRAGEGPSFLEILTYRWKEHVGPNEDYQLGYRTKAEADPWITTDPVLQLSAALDLDKRARLEAEVEEEIAEAFAFAEASPFPKAEALLADVFKEEHEEQIADCRLQIAEWADKSAI